MQDPNESSENAGPEQKFWKWKNLSRSSDEMQSKNPNE